MDSTSIVFLTINNYFQWKCHLEDLLRSKGLYQITLGKEKAPIDADKKSKWDNRNDEARGLIRISIAPDLRYHLQDIDDPKELGTRLNLYLVNSILFKQNS
jgi:hypothetical protein